jgi:transcriptional regulator with XRE-family HTH domain
MKRSAHGDAVVRWDEIARRLRQIRGGMSQIELGNALGIRQNDVSRYETGRVRPSLGYLVMVAQYGKVSLDWLITGKK